MAADLSRPQPPQQGIAGFTLLRDIGQLSDDETSTALRQLLMKSATAAGQKGKVRLLREAGMVAGDIDFVGEDLRTVFHRLKAGYDRVAPERRATWVSGTFGERAVKGAETTLGSLDTFDEIMAEMPGGRASLAASYDLYATSGYANAIRLENLRKIALAKSKSAQAAGRGLAALKVQLAEGGAPGVAEFVVEKSWEYGVTGVGLQRILPEHPLANLTGEEHRARMMINDMTPDELSALRRAIDALKEAVKANTNRTGVDTRRGAD